MSKNNKNNLPKINEEIKAIKVRLVDHNGEARGIVSITEALALAAKVDLDLVEVAAQSEPPVCKILDFAKFKYESKKHAQDSKKKQKTIVVKEMKFKPNIGIGDFNIKLRKIKEFLEDGNKVKISLWFRGREIIHIANGKQIFFRLIEELGEEAKIEHPPKMEGKQIFMVISPNVKIS